MKWNELFLQENKKAGAKAMAEAYIKVTLVKQSSWSEYLGLRVSVLCIRESKDSVSS